MFLSADFFFQKKSFKNTIRMSNSLEPDQELRYIGPDVGPNCLQRLSATDKSRLTAMERVKCEMDERNWKCIVQLTFTKSGCKFSGDIGYFGSTVAQW